MSTAVSGIGAKSSFCELRLADRFSWASESRFARLHVAGAPGGKKGCALPTEALQADGICGLSNGVGAPWIVARRARARAWSDSCGAKEESMVVNFQLVVCAAGVAAELVEMPRRG